MVIAVALGAFAATPQQLMATASKKLADAPSVSSTFTIVTNEGRGGQALGSMQMAKKAYPVGILRGHPGSEYKQTTARGFA